MANPNRTERSVLIGLLILAALAGCMLVYVAWIGGGTTVG
jgi:hypothetical protein